MATYPPPNFTEPLTVFNPVNWESAITDDGIVITPAYLNANYLKFPVAQGLETLQAITVNGVADFNNTVSMSSSLTMDASTIANRIISNVDYKLQDLVSGAVEGQIYKNGLPINYINSVNSGEHDFYTKNSSGSQTVPFSITSNGAIVSTNLPASPNSSLTVVDSSTGNAFAVIPNVGNSYNPSADINNIMLLGTGTQNAETLQLTTWSATNNYVKVRPTSVGMGAGGTSNTASSSVECNGTTVRIVPSLTFPDNSVQTTAFTGAVAGFTSGMIIEYVGTSAPSGFLFCDGSQVSQTTYASLFAVIGTKYNVVAPSAGNFFLPDFRDRSPIGSATTALAGNILNGGLSNIAYNANIYNGNKTLLANQLATHTHNLAWNSANYVDVVNTTNNTTTGGSSARAVNAASSAFPTLSGGLSNFFNFQGQGEYLTPVCSVNFIIKT